MKGTGMKVTDIKLDVDTLTLGEMMAAEAASGVDINVLLKRPAHRQVLALYVHQLRTSDELPSWKQLSGLKVLGDLPSTSDSQPDGDSTA